MSTVTSPANRTSLARQVGTLAAGAAGGQIVLLAVSPLVSRLYTPSEFGLLGLATSFLSISILVSTLRYEQAILSIPESAEARAILSSLLRWAPVLAGLCVVLLWIASRLGLFGFGELPAAAVALLLPILACAALFELARYYLVRTRGFATVASATVRSGLAKAALQVSLGFAGFGWAGLYLAELGGRLASLYTVLRRIPRGALEARRSATHLLRRHRDYATIGLPSALLNNGATAAQLPIITYLHGIEFAGALALVQRAISLPTSLLGRSVADVFHSHATERRASDLPISSLFAKTALFLLAAGAPPAFVVFLYGPEIFSFVFGEPWREAGAVASLMAPAALAEFVVSPVSRIIFVANRLRAKLIFDGAVLSAVAALPLVSKELLWAPLMTVRGLSAALVACYALYFGVLILVVRGLRRRP